MIGDWRDPLDPDMELQTVFSQLYVGRDTIQEKCKSMLMDGATKMMRRLLGVIERLEKEHERGKEQGETCAIHMKLSASQCCLLYMFVGLQDEVARRLMSGNLYSFEFYSYVCRTRHDVCTVAIQCCMYTFRSIRKLYP